MRLLGIDYGDKKIGLALADGSLAGPLKVIRFESEEDLFQKLQTVVEEEEIKKVVVGVSEGESAGKQELFASKLAQRLDIEVDLQDETLTTHDAQELGKEADIKRSRRKRDEDAFAATLILQSYLDNL